MKAKGGKKRKRKGKERGKGQGKAKKAKEQEGENKHYKRQSAAFNSWIAFQEISPGTAQQAAAVSS